MCHCSICHNLYDTDKLQDATARTVMHQCVPGSGCKQMRNAPTCPRLPERSWPYGLDVLHSRLPWTNGASTVDPWRVQERVIAAVPVYRCARAREGQQMTTFALWSEFLISVWIGYSHSAKSCPSLNSLAQGASSQGATESVWHVGLDFAWLRADAWHDAMQIRKSRGLVQRGSTCLDTK